MTASSRTIPAPPPPASPISSSKSTVAEYTPSSFILSLLLKLVHLIYSIILFLSPFIDSLRKLTTNHAHPLQAKDFSRLPAHLAFSFGHEQLKGGHDAASLQLSESSVHSVARLLSNCCALHLSEVTLFDEESFLSASVDSIAHQVAEMQAASPPFRSSVVFIQTQSRADAQIVYALFEGQCLLLDSAEIRPLVSKQRSQLLEYIRQFELGEIQADSPVTVISLLAGRHSQQSIVDATISRKERRSGNQKPAVREILQSSLLTFPLTEPDLLIVIQQGSISNGHRSLVGFPPWLLRTTEILFVETLQQLISGADSVFEDRLQEFANSVQRLGT